MQLGFQQQIQPDACTAPVAFTEGVGDVHLHILLNDLIKSGLRHLFNIRKRCFQVHHRSKTEVALGDVNCAEFAGKVVNLLKEVLVDGLQGGEGSGLQLIQQTLLKKLDSFLFADSLFFTGEISRGCESQFILKSHGETSLA